MINYGRKLLNILWCTKKTEDSFPSECNECMRTKVKQYILKDYPPMKDTKIKFERFLNKFVELYERISKCSYIDSIENCINDKIAEIENLMPPKKKKKRNQMRNW
ncbi:hypothetical protein NQ314_014724 [Rhamnusium bicolor]|uniref:Uncharacterized protein n=1 Tax=Rhamnusium bicolor TaxID=1586634 RepID=A0AAV8X134_9CUCU|nr:hypothetical protein NQ314_014724 [Rhamnusium bicolor]